MDKYEFNLKAEKMKKALDRKDYLTAAKIADSMNWERSTNIKVLMMIAQVYEKQGRYTEARNALTQVYNRIPVGKRVVYKLAELAVKSGDLDDAMDLYREYQEIAPDDPAKLILAYKISTARGDSLEKRISILEAYRRRDFDEKWAYELASLYRQAGRVEDCVSLCDEIILWFGVGAYVDKAMTLKTAYAPLTPEQEDKRIHKDLYEKKLAEVAALSDAGEAAAPEAEKPSPASDEDSDLSPAVKEAELHMTMEQELAQSIQSTSTDISEPSEEESHNTVLPEHTRTFSFGSLLAKTRRLDSLRDLAELDSLPVREEADGNRCPECDARSMLDPLPVREELDPAADGSDSEDVSESAPGAKASGEAEEPEAFADAEAEPDCSHPAELSESHDDENHEADDTESHDDEVEVSDFEPADTPEEKEPVPEDNQEMIFCHILALTDDSPISSQIKKSFDQAHRISGIPSASIARAAVDKLNRAGFNAALKKLNGRDLLVEHAGQLSSHAIQELMTAIEQPFCSAVILLTDTADGIDTLRSNAPGLFAPSSDTAASDEAAAAELTDLTFPEPPAAYENTEENMPAASENTAEETPDDPSANSVPGESDNEEQEPLSPDEFSQFIYEYAEENDCKFDSMAELALAAKIDRMELSGEPMNKASAVELVEKAITKAERWTFKSIFVPRYDRDGYLIIKESHLS